MMILVGVCEIICWLLGIWMGRMIWRKKGV